MNQTSSHPRKILRTVSISLHIKKMSPPLSKSLHLPLLFFINLRVGQIQYRIDNARNRIGDMVLYFVLRCCVLFWNLLVVFRCRIEFIENICRKLFSQYRPAGNDAVVMVNESHTIDSADRVNAENRVDILRFEQSPELVPCIVWAHGVFDCLPKSVERSVLLQRTLRPLVILLKSLVADIPADTARFKRSTDAIAVIGQGP